MSKKLANALGAYLANHLIDRHIPCLSCDPCTRNTVQVTSGEADELNRLEDAWFDNRNSELRKLTQGLKGAERYAKEQEADKATKDEWNALLKYRYVLKEKYLPHTLKCMIPFIDFSNEKVNKQIKEALIRTLWDWDFCAWSLNEEDIVFENETDKYGPDDKYSMTTAYVTLKLSLEAPSSFTGDKWIEIKTPQK